MIKLLISVRNASEAQLLRPSDLGIVDIKEPVNGALGKANPNEIAKVLSVIRPQYSGCPVSAAMGELHSLDLNELEDVPPVQFAKFGLSRSSNFDWEKKWSEAIELLPLGTSPVAVAYADNFSCDAPTPEDVIQLGATLGCGAMLIDTFDKSNGSTFTHLNNEQVRPLLEKGKHLNLKTVLAGGISSELDIQNAIACGPDFVGVRGAVCTGNRQGELDSGKLANFIASFNRLQNLRDEKLGETHSAH